MRNLRDNNMNDGVSNHYITDCALFFIKIANPKHKQVDSLYI